MRAHNCIYHDKIVMDWSLQDKYEAKRKEKNKKIELDKQKEIKKVAGNYKMGSKKYKIFATKVKKSNKKISSYPKTDLSFFE